VFYFGEPRSFSHEAAMLGRGQVAAYLARFGNSGIRPEDIVVKGEPTQHGLDGVAQSLHKAFFVVPISNSKLGDVYDFMPFYSYQMVGEVPLEVEFVLCNLSGNRDDVKSIVTKNTAYQQVVEDLVARGFPEELGRPDERSTSKAAMDASKNTTVAAVCSVSACREYGLKQVGEALGPYVTTFGIFYSEPKPLRITGRAEGQFPLLMRNANLYTGRVQGGGKVDFVDLLNTKARLRVKWGVDPLSATLHFGHLACLYKLKHFIAYGHEIVIVLGTFTGRVGDPSGNLTPRPRLEADQLQGNARTIQRQMECVLGRDNVRFESNADLVRGLDLERLLRWAYGIDYRLLVGRTDFRERIKNDRSLSLAEMLYGLLQAHDTVVLDVDVELGGLDQLHNCILMRDILKMEGLNIPMALLIPLLPGVDGDAKMSIFKGNHIAVTDKREAVRSKLLRIRSPGHIYEYFRAVTDVEERVISEVETAFGNESISLDELVESMADAVLEKLDPALEGMGD
jgi:tyrosyl-tRNA synthetase